MPLLHRIANLIRRSRLDREINAELESRIVLQTEENVAAGMAREQARRDALVRFGNRAVTREQVVTTGAALGLERFWSDLGYALRQLRLSPGFAATAILTLALGIGANTAVFSVTNTVLLRPLGYTRPERIFQLEKADESAVSYSASIPLFLEWRDHNQVFQNIGAYSVLPVGFNLAGKDRPERIAGLRVSADFFRVLGIEPRLGRNLTAQDDRDGAQRVVLLSESLWRRRYNNDPTIVGKQITMDGEPATIVGVLPAGFQFLAIAPTSTAIELWTPLRLPTASRDPSGVLECIARLKDGVTPAQAVSQMTTLSRGFAPRLPPAFPGQGRVELLSVSQRISEDVRPTLLLLLGATAFVLLIACANVANLLSIRMADRTRELALRAALGASRFRIIRQLLTESLLVGALGGISGLAVALASLRILAAFAPVSISQFRILTLDWRVLLCSAALSILTGVLSGLLPALRESRSSAANALRAASSSRMTSSADQRRLYGALTVAQTALSLVLLAAAGLLIESFVKLQRIDPGFGYAGLTTLETTLPPANFAEPLTLSRFLSRASQSIAGLPQVNSVTAMSTLPTEPTLNAPFTREDGPQPQPGQSTGEVDQVVVGPGYFATMEIPVLVGRAISAADRMDSPGVVVINQSMATKFFPGENPIGKRITIGKNLGPTWIDVPREVVGVAGDARSTLEEPVSPTMYTPFTQVPANLAKILLGVIPVRWAVRTHAGSVVAADELSDAVHAADSSIAAAEIRPMSDLMQAALARWRFNMMLFGAFAGVALALAAIGIFGVVSYSVSRRTQEIGIRMALGAQRSTVLTQVLGWGMKLAGVGTVLGVVASLGLTQLMRALLFGVSPTDPAILASVSLVLVFIALLACLIPARRAASIHPVQALRSE